MKLRPLIVVTGTVRVEGGDETRQVAPAVPDRGSVVVMMRTKRLTRDRRRANIITTGFMRSLRRILILRTPFGVLLDPAEQVVLTQLLRDVDRKVSDFNKGAKTCRLINAVLFEPLGGPRRAAVEGWLVRLASEKDPDILEALRRLTG